MYQPVTFAPLMLVEAEATMLKEVGMVAPPLGEDTVTVTVAEAAAGLMRSGKRKSNGMRKKKKGKEEADGEK